MTRKADQWTTADVLEVIERVRDIAQATSADPDTINGLLIAITLVGDRDDSTVAETAADLHNDGNWLV
jgi:hypothetical protein